MKYKFDWNDIRGPLTVLNVILIMLFGTSYAWLGLAIAVLGLVKDITKDKMISSAVMHFSNVLLNLFFISGFRFF